MAKQKLAKAFDNVRHNVFHLKFANGNTLSTIWSPGSYTENRDYKMEDFIKKWEQFTDTNTVEVMYSCDSKTEKKIIRKYGKDNPLGYLQIEQWVDVISILSK